MSVPLLACFGEILWDLLPDGPSPGGAPMNVAIHAQVLGLSAHMISRVGSDESGARILSAIAAKGLNTALIQRDATHPTGVAQIVTDGPQATGYDFPAPAAWDFIDTPDGVIDTVRSADALVFGSLACRATGTHQSLLRLQQYAKMRVFDINFRPPYYTRPLSEELLREADIVKLSEEEMAILLDWYAFTGSESEQLAFLRHRFDIDLIVLTKGAAGAACLDPSGYFRHPGFVVQVEDTIGSGDAFLAGFLSQLLHGANIPQCLEFACAIGALITTQRGATPILSEAERNTFMQHLILNHPN